MECLPFDVHVTATALGLQRSVYVCKYLPNIEGLWSVCHLMLMWPPQPWVCTDLYRFVNIYQISKVYGVFAIWCWCDHAKYLPHIEGLWSVCHLMLMWPPQPWVCTDLHRFVNIYQISRVYGVFAIWCWCDHCKYPPHIEGLWSVCQLMLMWPL